MYPRSKIQTVTLMMLNYKIVQIEYDGLKSLILTIIELLHHSRYKKLHFVKHYYILHYIQLYKCNHLSLKFLYNKFILCTKADE